MILDGPLLAVRDDDDVLDAGCDGLFDRVLDHRLVDERHHLLRLRLGGRKEPGAPPGGGQHGGVYAHGPLHRCCGGRAARSAPRRCVDYSGGPGCTTVPADPATGRRSSAPHGDPRHPRWALASQRGRLHPRRSVVPDAKRRSHGPSRASAADQAALRRRSVGCRGRAPGDGHVRRARAELLGRHRPRAPGRGAAPGTFRCRHIRLLGRPSARRHGRIRATCVRDRHGERGSRRSEVGDPRRPLSRRHRTSTSHPSATRRRGSSRRRHGCASLPQPSIPVPRATTATSRTPRRSVTRPRPAAAAAAPPRSRAIRPATAPRTAD